MTILARICAVALAIGLASATPALALITLDFQPSSQTKLLGDSASVDIVLSGLSAAGEIVSAFDLDVTYDPIILKSTAVTLTSVPAMGGLTDTLFDVQFLPGAINLSVLSFLSDDDLAALQGDTLTLARLFFGTLDVGTSPLMFDFSDPSKMIVGRDALPLDITAVNGSITVQAQPTPEPGSLLLLASGLVGLAGSILRRR